MEISTSIPARHVAIPMRDKSGREALVCIIKYTFRVDPAGHPTLDDEGALPHLVDVYSGDDATASTIVRHSDLYPFKPGTDVVLTGFAHPSPRAPNAASVDVSLRIGPIAKQIRAFGVRVWQRGGGSVVPGPARPLREPVPLLWELAWGGLDLSDPEHPVGDWRNTVGRGVTRNPADLAGKPATQLEMVGATHDVPACFAPIHRHWQPRVTFAGTHDDAWREHRMPIPPLDFDDRYHAFAPPDQWCPRPLRGDEPIEILGATPEGAWRFQLPRIHPSFRSLGATERRDHPTHLDTLHIDAEQGLVELTYRAAVPLPAKWQRLEKVHVIEKQLVAWQRNSAAARARAEPSIPTFSSSTPRSP